MTRVVIAGGGIAGLSIAHALRTRDAALDVVVLEKSARPGGNIRSEIVDGYTCEWGPDGFLDNTPDTLALASDVGLAGRLCPSSDAARRRFIFRHGVLHEVPVSPAAFLRSGLLSLRGKARIAFEPFAGRPPETDESIYDFAARRIGREAASVLIDSMVSGVFAGDARALSLRACFPRMFEMEAEHGGLFKALLARRKQRRAGDAMGAPAGRLTSFDGGMETFVRGVAASLGSVVRTSRPLLDLRKGRDARAFHPGAYRDGFTVSTPGATMDADAVVLAGPASESAALVRPFDSALAAVLDGIPTAPLAVICLGFDAAAVAADRGPLDGFGFLVPRSEGIRILGALWETSIYPKRAPLGKALLRVMIGGALDPHAVDLDDDALLAIVRTELRRTMRLTVAPEFVRIIRHARGIPQYTNGHLARLQRLGALLKGHPGLFLAGNSYRGVAINACVADAGPVAAGVLAFLGKASGDAGRAAVRSAAS
jgi:oxygen-dependent protoporphyrinogen oxidase